MDCGGDEDDPPPGAVGVRVEAGGGVERGGAEEVGEGCLQGVVGAQDVDVEDGFEGVGGEGEEGGEEVAGCSCAVFASISQYGYVDYIDLGFLVRSDGGVHSKRNIRV